MWLLRYVYRKLFAVYVQDRLPSGWGEVAAQLNVPKPIQWLVRSFCLLNVKLAKALKRSLEGIVSITIIVTLVVFTASLALWMVVRLGQESEAFMAVLSERATWAVRQEWFPTTTQGDIDKFVNTTVTKYWSFARDKLDEQGCVLIMW